MPKYDFNRVTLQLYRNRTSVWVNLLHIFRTPFPKNTFGRVFLLFALFEKFLA